MLNFIKPLSWSNNSMILFFFFAINDNIRPLTSMVNINFAEALQMNVQVICL